MSYQRIAEVILFAKSFAHFKDDQQRVFHTGTEFSVNRQKWLIYAERI